MNFRKTARRVPALLLIAVSILFSGCNRVSTEEAQAKLAAGIVLEQQNNPAGALVAYQDAARGDFSGQPQAEANLARVAAALKKYDVATQTYTALAQSHPYATINAAAPGQVVNNQKVRDWIGTAQDHKGPWAQADEALDQANRNNVAYKVMDFLVKLTGSKPAYSYALAILIFTVVIKLAMTPLTRSQFHSMRRMTAIQPKMKDLQDRYKDKPEELNKAMMTLYREEGVNPLGCGAGIVLQFPIMIALYQVIRQYNYQFQNGHFLWVNPATHALAPAILGRNLAQPDTVLLVLYAISMYLSQKLTVMPSTDPQQQQQQQMMAVMMPVMFLFVLKTYPSAFILYWLTFNVMTTIQQRAMLKKNPPPAPAAGGTPPPPAPPRSPDALPPKGPSRTPAKKKRK